MNDTTKEILLVWQQAHEHAENNPELLLKNEIFFELCEARMNVCSIADELLYNIPVNEKDNPKELNRHLLANTNKGCSQCRFGSFSDDNHPECNDKIKEWFKSKEQLLIFVELFL
jgi:hypothetical protein